MNIQSQLLRDEGCELVCYKDTLGNWTQGVGHLLKSWSPPIMQSQANAWLEDDILSKTKQLKAALPWSTDLDEPRFGVLLNMSFNMGVSGLLQFHHFLGFMETGHWIEAAAEMLNSKWAGQVHNRANRLADQVRTGIWT